MSSICKMVATVLFIFVFIGSIVLGNTFGIPGEYSFSDPSFNWAFFLCSLISGAVFCFLIYILGEIIGQLEISNSNSYRLYELLKKTTSQEDAEKK